jgi:hypothetical protein
MSVYGFIEVKKTIFEKKKKKKLIDLEIYYVRSTSHRRRYEPTMRVERNKLHICSSLPRKRSETISLNAMSCINVHL